ncbi:Nif3-like dinuclear metal center hexameric protein [Staphylococcus muscae]|uniref:GTP cyclohydrolase 1 type 2 homolog n=1 Tax=Staphylococcus muscae TaxID=1294 RepID=A0A240C372_9STAP|nr:Nif3-like dinuclear metal center hexameric protein [Staphylococcus muscae]AVQ33069.1 Nif3-like dinuclear metal center hexameric protein [Staphylococcus muscae]PNZ02813.1 Nif3-like dinuclear metal center hexameric protein [Staphylococcus muscae]GGA88601.1 GTP cyclohydrolase 1 type 2 [Staphylococcus muscae]SNW02467.1 NIF3 protein [Staphylococcus muscae]
MKLDELLKVLNKHVPFNSAESWDNVGLLIGDRSSEVTGIMTALDCTIDVVNEAIDKGCNTIVAHHPLIFKGMRTILADDGYGQIVYKLIQNNINLIAMHTNLDVHPNGVNTMLADRIALNNCEILLPQTETYYKVQVYIPEENADVFKLRLSEHGLAKEGNYEHAFFNTFGQGQFKPVGEAQPHIGKVGEIETVKEVKVEFMITADQRVLTQQLIHTHHPYETPVYDFIPLDKEIERGLGMIGELAKPMPVESFVTHVKQQLNMPSVRYIGDVNKQIQTVAIIGGSGIGYELTAAKQGADIFLTGDIKHHDALDAKLAGISLLDINHYSEYVMKEGLVNLLNEWLATQFNGVIVASESHTDPYRYM